jgi:hypothetical protein
MIAICELVVALPYWGAEIFLEIYYDQCGLEIISRHTFLAIAELELGTDVVGI